MSRARAEAPLLWLLLLLFASNTTFCFGPDDLKTLLSVRSSIDDPLGSLSTWTSSTPLCRWHGIVCNSNNSSHVSEILLPGKNLTGPLSPSLFSLPFLQTLDLSTNSFHGAITIETSSLRHLNLSGNNFSGAITFGSNGITTSLESLDLSSNYFSGEIPERIRYFSNLKVLDLGGNFLQGQIPGAVFSGLRHLEELTLASNQLVGRIPPEIWQITTLRWIYLGYNNLSGEIQPQIGNLTGMVHLDLVYNQLSGEIPESVGNLRNLQNLFLYMNHLSGKIPRSIYNLTAVISLDLSDNFLSGEISEEVARLQNLEILHMFSNRIEGNIPSSISSLRRLRVLQLWSNGISGEIPWDLGLKNNLTVLDLSTNNITGEIPEHICDSGRLYKLILFSNSLHGGIPHSLAKCRSLGRVRMENNKLSGEIPAEFTTLPLVYYLDLSRNNLSGRIDGRRWEMGSLEMLSLAKNGFEGSVMELFGSEKIETIDLSGSRFSGAIPAGFGRLSKLTRLNLSGNLLVGTIPEEISRCRKLVELDLSKNHLSGKIPPGFSYLPVLVELDLSENEFSGEVPPELGRSGSLVSVNISHNHFRGRLPETIVFSTINSTAVSGNRDLCGGSAASSLPRCRTPHWQFSVMALSAVLLLLSLTVLILLVIQRRRRENAFVRKVGDGNGHGSWEVRIFDDIALGLITSDGALLSQVKEGNVISAGSGHSRWLSVKEVVAEETEYGWREVTRLGRFRHRNVVRLAAAWRSERRWVFLHEMVEGRCLGEEGGVRRLDWRSRWKVAVGVASGLRSLHRRRVVSGFHTDQVVLVGEDDVEPHFCVRIPSGAVVSADYVLPPEVREGMELTEKSDVFSFGVMLIRLLTGRHVADPEIGSNEGIVRWAMNCYSDFHVEKWMDPVMKGHVAGSSLDEIVETMGLALRCTAADPVERPSMAEVLRGLAALRKEQQGSWVSRVKALAIM